MTRFYDNNNVLSITLRSLKTNEDFSQDFFEDACNHENYNEDLDAFRVDDVQYLVDYATSYADGTNRDIDYPEDWEPECAVQYDITDRPTMNEQDVESAAASLYDGGWRAGDKDELQKQEDLCDADADAIARKLAEYDEK